MNEKSQPPLDTLRDIKKIMERSSRFISLSGLSGVSAGICAIAGAWFGKQKLDSYYSLYKKDGYSNDQFQSLKTDLLVIAIAILAAALVTAFYFTWRKAKHNKLPLWDMTSKRLILNLVIPLVAGGLFILAMLQNDEWRYVAPASLVFYGLALLNASQYTLTDIRYLGYFEILLGLVNTQFVGYGLYFWTAGFGLLHIVYGFIMWQKYEKRYAPNPLKGSQAGFKTYE
jgi:hypothetical protein